MSPPVPEPASLQIWGGIECTINRLGDAFHRQLEKSGHDRRPPDIAAIASLGLRTLRYPVLWEDVAPRGDDRFDWRWPDERLPLLQERGIAPIVGLLHHGSGPPDTNLLDPNFPERFARYAGALAERYPWVSQYTPINEPLTTARFSGLYGYWYPHRRDDASFVRALLNQCRGVALAMQAIRRWNPAARLVQTEDLGRIFASRGLRYQARFENHRRWLTWDLLCGRVDETHPLRGYLRWTGTSAAELDWFRSNATPPDVIGINHYLTSNRYLHQDESLCPRSAWGGNGRERYADSEAVRALAAGMPGVGSLLREAWRRYGIPVAITEVHLGCTREEQLRWFHEAWNAARRARTQGVDVRAVTAWALLGSFDWDSLLTRSRGHYEPGGFDVSGPGAPRLTALGKLVQAIALETGAAQAPAAHWPVISSRGWWRRESRLLGARQQTLRRSFAGRSRRKSGVLLITGAAGTLGQAFVRACELRGLPFVACTRAELDIADRASIARALNRVRPWALVNAAGFVNVDAAETDCLRCYRENGEGPGVLAAECADRKLPMLTFSTDLVFDGESSRPYVEGDPVNPLSVYGRSKAIAETRVLAAHPGALVVRSSAFFGPWDRYNFVTVALESLRGGGSFTAADDVVVSPTYVPDLAHASLDLLQDGERGIWHLANRGAVTWAELARRSAALVSADASRLIAASCEELRWTAARPRFSALGTHRGFALPELDDALARYASERAAA